MRKFSRLSRDHVAQEGAEHARRFAGRRARLLHVHGVIAEVGQRKLAKKQAAVRVRVGAHAAVAAWRQVDELGDEGAVLVEELFRAVASQPFLELADSLRVLADVRERNLMRAPRVLHGQAVDLLRSSPALRRAQDQHRPSRPARLAVLARGALDARDVVERVVERRRELLVHVVRLVARHDQRPVAVALEQREQLGFGDAREDGRIRDLVAVQMEDRQDGAVGLRVEELVRVPAGGERSRLRLTVADDAGDEQIRVVERGAECVRERVAELAALVDRSRSLRCGVTRNPTGERELAEEPAQSFFVAADVRVDLAVRSFEVGACDDAGPAVTRPGDEDRAEIARADRAVEVCVDAG